MLGQPDRHQDRGAAGRLKGGQRFMEQPPGNGRRHNRLDQHQDARQRCRGAAKTGDDQALPADLGAPVIERALASLALTDRDVAPVVDWSLARARQNEVDRG